MMFANGIVTQISTTAIAVGILVAYVQPAFISIGEVQDNIVVYQQEREKIKGVNQQLSALIEKMNSVSLDDEKRLLTYLPNEIDEVSVQRDLILITEQVGIAYTSANYDSATNAAKVTDFGKVHSFTLSFEATYKQLKELLLLLEQNEYPIYITEMKVNLLEGGFLSVDISVETFTHYVDDEMIDDETE